MKCYAGCTKKNRHGEIMYSLCHTQFTKPTMEFPIALLFSVPRFAKNIFVPPCHCFNNGEDHSLSNTALPSNKYSDAVSLSRSQGAIIASFPDQRKFRQPETATAVRLHSVEMTAVGHFFLRCHSSQYSRALRCCRANKSETRIRADSHGQRRAYTCTVLQL